MAVPRAVSRRATAALTRPLWEVAFSATWRIAMAAAAAFSVHTGCSTMDVPIAMGAANMTAALTTAWEM